MLALSVLCAGTSSAAIIGCRDWFVGQVGEYQVENNVVLPAGLELAAQEIFRGALPALPPGEYTWLHGFTRPGSQELVSNLAQAVWRFE
jgi:hypothetical protein